MKKLFVPMIVVFIGFISPSVFAACASTDIMCYVVGAVQKFRVTSAGNTSVAGTLAVTGNTTHTGTVTNTGAVSNSSNVTTAGKTIFTPQTVTVSSGTTITPTSTFINLVSTGGLVTIGGSCGGCTSVYYVPIATANATAGQVILLISTSSASVAITTNPANGTIGSATTLATASPKVLQFMFDAVQSVWREVHN